VTGRRGLLLTLHVSGSASNLGATALTLVLLAGVRAGPDGSPAGWVSRLGVLCVDGVLVPLLLVALLTGVVSALTSPWGLFRHGWVVKKLLLTLAAVAIGLAVVRPGAAELGGARASWLLFAGLASQLALLVLTTVLSVFKPPGRRNSSLPKTRRPGGLRHLTRHLTGTTENGVPQRRERVASSESAIEMDIRDQAAGHVPHGAPIGRREITDKELRHGT
jgi:hypothetical protein